LPLAPPERSNVTHTVFKNQLEFPQALFRRLAVVHRRLCCALWSAIGLASPNADVRVSRDLPRRNGSGAPWPTRLLKKFGASVDDECSQDNKKDNRGDERRPVIVVGAPRVGPLTIVARATRALNVWVYHIRASFFGRDGPDSRPTGRAWWTTRSTAEALVMTT
jgi:hypothetical protein